MIINLTEIAKELEILPNPARERAGRILKLNDSQLKGVNCAVAARYIMGLSDDLQIPRERYPEFVRFENSPESDSRLLKVKNLQSGDLIVFHSLFMNEHFGISLREDLLFSMLGVYGQGGKWAVDSIEATKRGYDELAKEGHCDPIKEIFYLRKR